MNTGTTLPLFPSSTLEMHTSTSNVKITASVVSMNVDGAN